MIRINSLKFSVLYLSLVVQLVLVVAFPPSLPKFSLEEEKAIKEKIEFLKLNQKGCSQAVFVHGEKELNCTISLWYTGTFPMWMIRNDVIMDLKKATEQELRSLPVQLCSCKKVQVSDLCPIEALGIPDILLHACNNSDENSTGIPVDGVVADLIRMVDDIKKLENISVVLAHTTTKSGFNDGKHASNNSLSPMNIVTGSKEDVSETTEAKINAKAEVINDKDNKTLRYKYIDIDNLKKEMKEFKNDANFDNDKYGTNGTNQDDNDTNKKYDDSKGSTTPTLLEDKIKEINDHTSVKATEDDDNEDKINDDSKDSDDKIAEDNLTKSKKSKKDKSDEEVFGDEDEDKNTGSSDDDGSEHKTDNKDETKEELKDKTTKYDKEKEEDYEEEKKKKKELETKEKADDDDDDDDDDEDDDGVTRAALPKDDDMDGKTFKDKIEEIKNIEVEDSSYDDMEDDDMI